LEITVSKRRDNRAFHFRYDLVMLVDVFLSATSKTVDQLGRGRWTAKGVDGNTSATAVSK